eukprot:TRINITY_DN27955_c0_g1_i1.p1 TRINITY_DN27955_c0_g1~~TRINITY_DN27955_c0_g1_i1.p1  ORF type:complete len:109 (-),score=10.69 TRINITY_DN27955_c0_g1_i1:66-392(-)
MQIHRWFLIPMKIHRGLNFFKNTHVLKRKAGVENKPADALSRKVTLIHSMSVEVIGFDQEKEDYQSCPDFGELYASLLEDQLGSHNGFVLQEGFLFKGNKLCIPRTSL